MNPLSHPTAHRAVARSAAAVLMIAGAVATGPPHAEPNPQALEQRIETIDQRHPGELGVYIKHLGSGAVVRHNTTDRDWYLASTIKVPVAVATLQAVEEGRMSLSDILTLRSTDFVDGAGDLLWQQPGSRYNIGTLLEKSLTNSDSTATDMLIRHLGQENFNARIRDTMVGTGFNPITTILQVRYDAYAELHPNAGELSNMDYVHIRSAGNVDARVREFMRRLGIDREQLWVETLDEAFERYYERDLNSANLEAFGLLLERLVRGDLLNERHTNRLLGHMRNITTGDTRLKAGLPGDIAFAQKTGTQIERACNVGIVHPETVTEAVVIASCAEQYGPISEAEQMFQQVARAMDAAGWL